MKSGFINIYGRPNAGKSTLLNALLGEKISIVSSRVQTTRHRIKGILNGKNYQLIFSDTPGIITPAYKLQEKMMKAVNESLVDADLALLLVDVNEEPEAADKIFSALKLKAPALVIINKTDLATEDKTSALIRFFQARPYCKKVLAISAKTSFHKKEFLRALMEYLPEGSPYYPADELSDRQTRFFVSEFIREKIYAFTDDEIPYQAAVLINEFREKNSLVKITAEVIVQKETQKKIMIGEGGKNIKKLGTAARRDIEKFLDQKIFLELFVKVKPGWRENKLKLREYGY